MGKCGGVKNNEKKKLLILLYAVSWKDEILKNHGLNGEQIRKDETVHDRKPDPVPRETRRFVFENFGHVLGLNRDELIIIYNTEITPNDMFEDHTTKYLIIFSEKPGKLSYKKIYRSSANCSISEDTLPDESELVQWIPEHEVYPLDIYDLYKQPGGWEKIRQLIDHFGDDTVIKYYIESEKEKKEKTK